MPRPFRPMAIVAATGLLPGARDLGELWRAFEDERTSIGPAPDSWLDRSVHHDPDPAARNKSYSETVALMPPWEFSSPPRLPPKQLAGLDPTHRLALELGGRVVSALEQTWLPRESTGVWVANVAGTLTTQLRMVAYHASERWTRAASRVRPDLAPAVEEFHRSFQERHPHPREEAAINGNILPGRIANFFDLQGPQMAVDANCASSLAALRSACLTLEDGGCDVALVAAIGVQLPELMVVSAKARAIASRPSFPFDRHAEGYVPGEGGVMVALVRAEDARRRGLKTLGVMRSIGTSVNGRGTAPWSPSEEAERLAVERAWAEGELPPDAPVDYIEAHGTATQVGDATEHAAMLATYGARPRPHPIPFGSIKSMVGHTVETAGLAGLLRALYVFDRDRIPPNVGVSDPAGYVGEHADRLRLAVHSEPLPPREGPRRVVVNSFGVGGVNFHAILESGLPEDSAEPPVRRDREPIAVVGMSAVMPDAPDAKAVWDQLRSGTAVRTPLAEHIPEFDTFHSHDVSDRDRTVCPASAVVDPPVLAEPARWRILPHRAGHMFGDHLLLLNAASAIVADETVPSSADVRVRSGVFVTDILDSDSRNALLRVLVFERWRTELRRHLADRGADGAMDEIQQALTDDPALGLGSVTEDASMAGQGVLGATRVASGLDLRGTAVSVNSACASGLAALMTAVQELRAHTLDFALVGGASLAVDESNQVALSAIGSLSPNGRGRPYDAAADGFLIGSGAAWFALKRLADAERDGDEILAVVRECGGTSDGRGRSMLAPSLRGRQQVVRRTYERAGLDPRTVQYVEGHGAASALGDASEIQVVAEEMAAPGRPVMVGSVKGNYGHLKGPAAFAGLAKVILCLRHRTLVPTPGLTTPGDLAGVRDGRVHLVDKTTDWPENGGLPRRAGLNAFGLGGTNYHAVIDEYVPPAPGRRPGTGQMRVSADSAPQLADLLAEAAASADRAPQRAEAADGPWRAAVVAPGDRAARAQARRLAEQIRSAAPDACADFGELGVWAGPPVRTGPVVMLFPGQAGAQFFETVAWLATNLPGGPRLLGDLEDVLKEPGRTLRKALTSGDIADLGALRSRSGTSQVLGLAAAELLRGRFERRAPDLPRIALGHSAGEFAALVAAGSLTFRDALLLCWERGRFAEEVTAGARGLMAAVFGGPDEVAALIGDTPDVHLATVNGPAFCVVAGWADAVEETLARAESAGISTTRLDVTLPFHTPLLADAVPELRALLDRVPVAAPRMPVYSAVLDGPYPAEPDAVRDAITRLYVEPVHLDRLVELAARTGARRFVECGTGRSLSRSVDAVLSGTPHLALPGLSSPSSGFDRLDAGLWAAGLNTETATRPGTSRPVPGAAGSGSVSSRSVPGAAGAGSVSSRSVPGAAGAGSVSSRSAPGAAGAAPGTSRPAPRTPDTAPGTSRPAPRTPDTAPGTSRPAPRTPDTAPGTSRPAPRTADTAPGTSRPAPQTTGTAPVSPESPVRDQSVPLSQSGSGAPRTSAAAPDFRLYTPVPVPATPFDGASWQGVPVVVAAARPGPEAAHIARALARAGAVVEAVGVRELVGDQAEGALRSARDLARSMAEPAGPRWLVWVCCDSGPHAPDGGVAAARTMAELACLRAVTAGLAEGWERFADGGALFVTRADGRLGTTEAVIDPSAGALAGLSRALGHECPTASTVVYDLAPATSPTVAAQRIADLGRPPRGHHERGLDGDALWRAELTPLPLTPARSPSSASYGGGFLDDLRRPDAAVLVSGGTTGVMARLLCAEAERLDGPLPGRLVLLSRTPADDSGPPPDRGTALRAWRQEHPGRSLHDFEAHFGRLTRAREARATLDRLAAAGITVEHAVMDVTDVRAVRALGERLRLAGLSVRTVVHGAGVERSRRVTDKPAEDWEATAATKIVGLHALVDAAGDDLGLLVAHGSVSGSLGLPGQTDYSAANEYMAKALTRIAAERPRVRVQYVGWPAWDRIGIAAAPEIKRRLQGAGLRYLDPDTGTRWAETIVARADILPTQTVLLPSPLPPQADGHAAPHDPPTAAWWLVDTVSRHGRRAVVRRRYDTAGTRDQELGDHRVRGNIRLAGVHIVEQFAQAYVAASASAVPDRLELCAVTFHQGLVIGTDGRRDSWVEADFDDDGSARLTLRTAPTLRGGLPGPGSVTVATAVARTVRDTPPVPSADLAPGRPVADVPDAVALAARYGIAYAGRFATPVTVLDRPGPDVVAEFDPGPPPDRRGRWISDPAALDTAVRTVAAAAARVPGEHGLPSSIGRVLLFPARAEDTGTARRVRVAVRSGGGYDLLLTDLSGAPVAVVEALRLTPPADSPLSHRNGVSGGQTA
ncbi:SDR family NAD(P)-dependent oxidoreductase [Streptomyces sp. NPDC046939]|uniref:SDR family NAD(P)-dependent oxidoreductase n=1 Tax=Streptomyces sp. NPDC046939 TaxID=3155376 RepID=UPI0034003564